MKVWMLLLATLAFSLNAAAQTNLEIAVSHLKKERAAGKGRLIDIIGGAGRAFLHGNIQLKLRKLPEFYCQPGQLVLNESNYADIALEQYERDKSLYIRDQWAQDYGMETLVGSLFHGLVRTFPCK